MLPSLMRVSVARISADLTSPAPDRIHINFLAIAGYTCVYDSIGCYNGQDSGINPDQKLGPSFRIMSVITTFGCFNIKDPPGQRARREHSLSNHP